MSDIQELLGSLKESRVTPAVLDALDFVVPGEWHNVTSLEEAVRVYCGVTDPTEVMRIRNKALELYAAQGHYARAYSIFAAVDKVDRLAAAAVMANQIGQTFSMLSILDKFTPKPETTQAIDAALKLTAEIAAFASLRGIPLTSLTEAKAFPATLATYARADLMRLAAWMTLDGLLPLGPEFVDKVRDVVEDVDLSVLTGNPLFQQLKGLLPGSSDEENRGYILSALDSASDWVATFIEARGLSQEDLASKLGSVINVAESGMDILAATIDATTDYFRHTGVQSVARVLVHDAQEALAAGGAEASTPSLQAEAPAAPAEGGGWFGKMAAAAAGGAAGVAVGAMMFRGRGDDDKAADALGALDDDGDDLDDMSLDDLDEGSIAAREAALEMKARELMQTEARMDKRQARMMRRKLMQEREMLRRSRKRRGRRGTGGGRRGAGRAGRAGGGRGRGRRNG
ncbi:MAG: hypothetical protein ACI8PZ_001713 [Myxococcota bacterium]|jgi:hypothetical protein